MKSLKPFLLTAAFIALWVGVWYLIWKLKLVSPAALPSPLEVIESFPAFLKSKPSDQITSLSVKAYREDVLGTLWRSFIAFLLSVPIGIVFGFIIFYAGRLQSASIFLTDFLRSIPATALVPIFLIIFGIGDAPKIAAGVFSASLVICLATVQGLKNRNQTRVEIAELIGIKRMKRILLLDFPESLSQIFVGLRTGVSLALILVVVGEMIIGSNDGLGKVVNDARNSDAVPEAYCALILLGVIGYIYNWVLIFAQRYFIHWQGH